jgi:hypothetical protein
MAGFELGLAFAIFGVGAAVFFASISYLLKAPNSGVFKFLFISIGLICLIFTAGNMAYLTRATEGTTQDISAMAPTFDYVLYGLATVFALWSMYFVLGILVGGVNFAMSFLKEDDMDIKKEQSTEEDRIIKY